MLQTTCLRGYLFKTLVIFPLFFFLSMVYLQGQDQAAADQSQTAASRDQSVMVNHGSRLKFGGISVGAGYSHSFGHYGYPMYGVYYPYWGNGWSPWWDYYPAWGWGYAPFYPLPRTAVSGEIKLQSADKNAEVFIDGAFAGMADDLKSFWLEPGVYDLKIKNASGGLYQKRLYVLSGKTLKVSPVFSVPRKEE